MYIFVASQSNMELAVIWNEINFIVCYRMKSVCLEAFIALDLCVAANSRLDANEMWRRFVDAKITII